MRCKGRRHWRVERSPEIMRQCPGWECRLVLWPEGAVRDFLNLVVRTVEEVIRCLAQGKHVEGKVQQRPQRRIKRRDLLTSCADLLADDCSCRRHCREHCFGLRPGGHVPGRAWDERPCEGQAIR